MYIGLPLKVVEQKLKHYGYAYTIIDNTTKAGIPFVTNCVREKKNILITISNFEF